MGWARRVACALVLAALAAPVAAGAAAPMRVVFINPGRSDEAFWTAVAATMAAAARDLAITLEVRYAERDRLRMRDMGLAAAAETPPPDYLVIVNEEGVGADVLAGAEAQGVATLFLLNDLTEAQAAHPSPARIGAVTPDNARAGAEMLAAVVAAARAQGPQPVRVLALAGDRATPASVARTQGMEQAAGADPAVTLERVLHANWREDEAEKLAARHLDWAAPRGQTPRAVWAANDPIAFGALRALRAHGLTPGRDVWVAGLNWSPEAVALVRRGEMVMTHGGHFLGGAWAMVALRDHFDAGPSAGPIELRFPMTAITQANAGAYAAALGDQDWDRIDFARFRRAAAPGAAYAFTLDAVLAQFP